MAPETSKNPELVLQGVHDAYGGVIIDAATLPDDKSTFSSMITYSLKEWQSQGKRGIWLKVPVEKIGLVPVAVEEAAFRLHHAEEGYVMLTHWIPDTPCTLPPNASHQVGVGALVLNANGDMLCVQERNGPLKGMKVWKMPTGLVQAGEHLSEAAEREVLEETGVSAKFDGVLAFRQAHGFQFDKSDLFFVCILKVEGEAELQAQECEIEAAAWIPISEYAAQEFFNTQPLHRQLLETCMGYVEGRVKPMSGASFLAGRKQQRRDLLMWCTADGTMVEAPLASNGVEAAGNGMVAAGKL